MRFEDLNMYDFYERLMNGENAEDIAKSITEELNKAQKAKEAADKAQQVKKQQTEAAQTVTDAINAYLKEYHPNLKATITVDDFIKTMDVAAKTALAFDTVLDKLDTGKEKIMDKTDNLDTVIDNFLKKMGW